MGPGSLKKICAGAMSLIFILCCAADASGRHQISIFQTDGFAPTGDMGVLEARDAAMDKAIETAVVQAVGRVTTQEMRDLKSNNIQEKIINQADPYIVNTEILFERVEGGILRVTMEVFVDMDKLDDDISLLPADEKAILSDRPLAAVFAFLREEGRGEAEAYETLAKSLRDMLDANGLGPLGEDKMNLISRTSYFRLAQANRDVEGLVRVTGQQDAKFVLIADAYRHEHRSGGIKGCNLGIRYRFFDTADPAKAAADATDATPVRGSCDTAAREAAEERFDVLANPLKAQGVLGANTKVKVSILVRGLENQFQSMMLGKTLRELPNVMDAARTSYAEGGAASYEVVTKMAADQLAALIALEPIGGLDLDARGKFGKAYVFHVVGPSTAKEGKKKE